MDCTQEIQHWLARNNLQELAQRFQTHRINSLHRLYSLNPMLIRELIPEIGLRLEFMECWTQFKLRGTLRYEYEQYGPKNPTTPITYQNSQGRPVEIFELHPLQQGANVNYVNYTPRQNVFQENPYNVEVPDLPSRNICVNDVRTISNKSPASSIELIEQGDPIPEGYVTESPADMKPSICTHYPNRDTNIPDEVSYGMILGHNSERGNISTLQDKSNLIQNDLKAYNYSQVLPDDDEDDDVQILSSEVQSIDSGWGSNSSNIQSPESVQQNKRKADRTEPSNSRKKSKSKESTKHSKSVKYVDTIKELDLISYLMSYSIESRGVVETYQRSGVLLDKDRSVICDALSRRLMRNKKIPYTEFELAAQKICECFPGESEVFYYSRGAYPKTHRTGKLYNKVHNLRSSEKRKMQEHGESNFHY